MCSQCVMDTSDNEIIFDEYGICNHCHRMKERLKEKLNVNKREARLSKLICEIKRAGIGKTYDCIIGLSGGIDSTYVAYKVKEFGLRPLAVHLDNGWDSELAVKNIENIVTKLNIDLYSHVIDWEEFKQIQLAYLRASVIDIEVPTDHAILAALYKTARKYKVSYILNGCNAVTESIMPRSWLYPHKLDSRNLKDIVANFGKVKLKTFPTIGLFSKLYCQHFLKIENIAMLDYLDYCKNNAKIEMMRVLGWVDYGGKHYESVFTKFYQAYILPRKFKVDKRLAHLSCLINSGQMTRCEALQQLAHDLYPVEELRLEKGYVLKKLGLSDEDFEAIMTLPIRQHEEFLTEDVLWKYFYYICAKTKNIRNVIKLRMCLRES